MEYEFRPGDLAMVSNKKWNRKRVQGSNVSNCQR